MALPLKSPIQPQLARSKPELPRGEQWVYEPKYDGFRAIAFVDGDESMIQSRGGKPLSRYFPELTFPPGRYILDGEIVIDGEDGLQDFDALQNRIHPAASRIAMLAEQTPAHYVAFDVLARDDESLLELPLAERRAILEELVTEPITLTPLTDDPDQAEPWLERGEGVVAKDCRAPYRPGQRTGMVKVKRVRTIDVVVAGWRPGKEEGTVGSLILGLYDPEGKLHIVGHSSGLRAKEKRTLVDEAEAVRVGAPRSRRPEPVEEREGARVDRPAARARRRDHVRPYERRSHSPRHEDPALARGQGAAGLPARADEVAPQPRSRGRR